MTLDQRKHVHKQRALIRDIRPMTTKIADALMGKDMSFAIFMLYALLLFLSPHVVAFADVFFLFICLYFWWLTSRDRAIAFKLPLGSPYKDTNNEGPGRNGESEGIMYLGNTEKEKEEVWFTNSDIRTHILYLGTTGAGKTEGLKSMVTNTMAWSSGFVYVDGKADTDLWSSLSALVRRFGRDDDLLVLNYMTGNSDVQAPSNTMNPFSSGSASYLTNMLVSLMPDSQGDNAMWSERAISLVSAIMPVLTWKRDNQEVPMSVKILRDNLSLNAVIKLARDEVVPRHLREGLIGYLDTLPGFDPNAYDDDGKVKPPSGGGPPPDTQTASQQHGYLAMQFTRSLQSLGDDYGYIFDTQAADVDMVDVVLQRRILVVLIPALEKSGDEIANLGKIVAATIKGMMGSALGSTVEGTAETVIENKPTKSSTPFMTVFDEVGYYTAEGMAVMAAQARSLGFCLVFSGQDLPAMKKRVREEANSITANCNLKLFGKLEDPTETKEFFEKTVGTAFVTEVSSFQGSSSGGYSDTKQAGVQERARASYDELRAFKEGQAIVTFGESVFDCRIFYSNPGHAKAMRVTRFMSLPPPSDEMMKHSSAIRRVRDLFVKKDWTAKGAEVALEPPVHFEALNRGYGIAHNDEKDPIMASITAIVEVYALDHEVEIIKQPPKVEVEEVKPDQDVEVATVTEEKSEQGEAESSSTGGSSGGVIPPPPASPPPAVTDDEAAQKPAIFGGGKVDTPPTAVPPPAISDDGAAQKPAIFGGGKVDTPPTAVPPPAVSDDGAAQKPAIFGGGKVDTPPTEQKSAPPLDASSLIEPDPIAEGAAPKDESSGSRWQNIIDEATQQVKSLDAQTPVAGSDSMLPSVPDSPEAAQDDEAIGALPALPEDILSILDQAGHKAQRAIFLDGHNKSSSDDAV